MKRRVGKLFAGTLCLFAWSVNAQDTIPKEMLDLGFQQCANDCIPGFGEVTCKPLCECTMGEFQKRMNYAEYLALHVELSRSETSIANRQLLDTIATHCTAELDRKGIEIGSPVATPKPVPAPEPAQKPLPKPKGRPLPPPNPD